MRHAVMNHAVMKRCILIIHNSKADLSDKDSSEESDISDF